MKAKKPFIYKGEYLREVAFPLGGIGTGCISLEGRGALRDWEIFNRPNKGTILPMTFAALWLRGDGGTPRALAVQGPRMKDFVGEAMDAEGYGHGQIRGQGDGLPHFSGAVFRGTFPFARIKFSEPGLPLDVELEAWSPFIPLDERSSGFPVACLFYHLKNRSDKPVSASLAFNLLNAIGFGEPRDPRNPDQALNEWREGNRCRGVCFTNARYPGGHPRQGTMALATDWPDAAAANWLRGGWFDPLHNFWDNFSATGEIPPAADNSAGAPVPASLILRARLDPGVSATLPVVIAWCFPTAVKYWAQPCECGAAGEDCRPKWTNYYAKDWPTAWHAAEEFFARRRELHRRTRAFERALFASTLPPEALESVSATASVLRSPTCLRLEDGTFWAWEGCSPRWGCCDGSCTHVWNYALTPAFLFPELHRSMRRAEYEHGFAAGEDGRKGAITFRVPAPLGTEAPLFHAASDGQLGGVVQLYRDWKLSRDDDYLRLMWPGARRALEYAWVQWDTDRDGLVDGDQHNTYDINFQGPNPLAQGFYLAALRAAAEMARHLGENDRAGEYQRLFEAGRAKTEAVMFNGEYFEQVFDCLSPDAPKYQHGRGCLSDQLFGQFAAHIAGLGHILDPQKTRSALAAVFRHNFRDPLGAHANMQRIYAMAGESALVLCSWPRGGRPAYPFPYSDEAWTGIEYQVAAHLIIEGMVEEGLRIARAVRARHDGRRRNPYNEFECGSHYARAMSAWGLLVAMSGVNYGAPLDSLTAEPRLPAALAAKPFQCFFCAPDGWGTISKRAGQIKIKVIERKRPAKP
ncbi:MAG: GH116 family glycosyl-hydrolase [bacterium]|nr:GH116 family glycosyl hydrolase [Candidatus Sumerlaeota bacterium]